MPVTSMTLRFGPAPKPRPKIGDRKFRKDGVELERRQCHTRQGGIWYPMVKGSRPMCEWVPVGTPHHWER
jgi:hypothetical protein